jgi:hypothetical protein
MRAEKTLPMMANGKLVACGPYPDHATRIAAATLVAKLRGDFNRSPAPQPPPEPLTFGFVLPAPRETSDHPPEKPAS